ncbi:MAG: SpoIIE family protein phosphatase, partial [Oscillospiraceae bacterium]|nr:SpoIIE family protein phosphatase [Oscillospiraceae bacterium]
PEAINRKNEPFGLDRALDTLNNMPSLNPELLIETVHNAVDTFAGKVPQFDDLTLLSLVWHGSENSEQ